MRRIAVLLSLVLPAAARAQRSDAVALPARSLAAAWAQFTAGWASADSLTRRAQHDSLVAWGVAHARATAAQVAGAAAPDSVLAYLERLDALRPGSHVPALQVYVAGVDAWHQAARLTRTSPCAEVAAVRRAVERPLRYVIGWHILPAPARQGFEARAAAQQFLALYHDARCPVADRAPGPSPAG